MLAWQEVLREQAEGAQAEGERAADQESAECPEAAAPLRATAQREDSLATEETETGASEREQEEEEVRRGMTRFVGVHLRRQHARGGRELRAQALQGLLCLLCGDGESSSLTHRPEQWRAARERVGAAGLGRRAGQCGHGHGQRQGERRAGERHCGLRALGALRGLGDLHPDELLGGRDEPSDLGGDLDALL